jgi:hypothetical protein
MRLAIVANTVTPTNRRLLEAADAFGVDALLLAPDIAERTLGAGDVAVGRIDVLPTLDGPEPGLESLRALEERASSSSIARARSSPSTTSSQPRFGWRPTGSLIRTRRTPAELRRTASRSRWS